LEIKGDKIMLAKDTMIKVTNRDNGTVGYSIPELHVTRLFQRDEVKEISMDELRKLSYIPGGQVIINECLIIHNEQALKELNPDYEPEYFYTEEDVKRLLLTGSQEEFLDCLDFAPEGVLNLVKTLAVDLEINDLAKREAIRIKEFGEIALNSREAYSLLNDMEDILGITAVELEGDYDGTDFET
jgi:hypothetical protein